jgi:NAD(P)-dependent dehydrogenase (short-subunit alcohol dehydrogenase family)
MTDESVQRVFITGVSSGIGLGLSRVFLAAGWHVYGVSRRVPDDLGCDYYHIACDLADFDEVPNCFEALFAGVNGLDLVILNAGILGRFTDMRDATLDELEHIMNVNLWSNKVILDWLFANLATIRQVVTMSSGAAVNGSRGWSGYAISKAALNMLTTLYARELPDTHFTAFAPGIIDTAMQDYIYDEVDTAAFPSVKALHTAKGTEAMPDIETGARLLYEALPKLLQFDSGSFKDLRSVCD